LQTTKNNQKVIKKERQLRNRNSFRYLFLPIKALKQVQHQDRKGC